MGPPTAALLHRTPLGEWEDGGDWPHQPVRMRTELVSRRMLVRGPTSPYGLLSISSQGGAGRPPKQRSRGPNYEK